MDDHERSGLRYGFGLGGWIPRALAANARIEPESKEFSGDAYWMGQALLAAMAGNGRPHPNPCVGVVVVKDGKLLAQGVTQAFGDLHAERVVIGELDQSQTKGATIYTTLEPCIHHGKQPPCSEALIAAGFSRCVIGTEDPFPAVAGRGIAHLRAAGLDVAVGCMQAETRAWHFPFLAHQTLKQARPVLIGKWAQTLDGHLADDRGRSQWISGPRSRAYGHWLRQKYDAVLVGIGTVFADAPSLTVRQSAPPRHRHPHKIVFDPYGRLAQATADILESLRSELRSEGPLLFWLVQKNVWKEPVWWSDWKDHTLVVPLEGGGSWADTIQSLADAYSHHWRRPLQSVLVEGGPQILTQLMRADLLDAWQVFLRAAVLGGQAHRIGRLPVREGEDPYAINPLRTLQDKKDFALISSFQLDDDIVLECTHRRFEFWPKDTLTA